VSPVVVEQIDTLCRVLTWHQQLTLICVDVTVRPGVPWGTQTLVPLLGVDTGRVVDTLVEGALVHGVVTLRPLPPWLTQAPEGIEGVYALTVVTAACLSVRHLTVVYVLLTPVA